MDKILYTLLYYLIRVLDLTYKIEIIGLEKIDNLENPKGYISGCWHQSLLPYTLFIKRYPIVCIVSPSKDGEYVAVPYRKFGHITCRGSSNDNGKSAMLQMIREMKKGTPGAMALDGPKGPPRISKPGTAHMAKVVGVPIIPFSAMPKSFYCFNKSWDNFRVPYPFTKIIIKIGDPIYVDKNSSKEEFNNILEKLNKAVDQGEKECSSLL